MNCQIDINFWNRSGFVFIQSLLSSSELIELREVCDAFLSGQIDAKGLRSDLSGTNDEKGKENITQIMRPSMIKTDLHDSDAYKRIISTGRALLGEDVEIDFDMIINKTPHTETITPWHQDAAYWPPMKDLRSCSFWIALDDVDKENGCMQYIGLRLRSDHDLMSSLRPHSFAQEGGALKAEINNDDEITNGILKAGSAIAHHGYTLHGALGNVSDRHRRAWIVNMRPKSMIEYLRSKGYDHTGKRKTQADA